VKELFKGLTVQIFLKLHHRDEKINHPINFRINPMLLQKSFIKVKIRIKIKGRKGDDGEGTLPCCACLNQ
jgi:hypothetical protein